MLKVFGRAGCFATRIEMIAADLRIGKSTLYKSFDSQRALLSAAERTAGEEVAARCQREQLRASRDSDAGLAVVIRTLLKASRTKGSPHSPDTLSRLACCNRWLSGTYTAPSATIWLADLVRRWQRAAVLDTGADPEWISGVILALVSSPATLTVIEGQELDAVAERVTKTVRMAFAATRKPS